VYACIYTRVDLIVVFGNVGEVLHNSWDAACQLAQLPPVDARSLWSIIRVLAHPSIMQPACTSARDGCSKSGVCVFQSARLLLSVCWTGAVAVL
jgi:hypothetical protein